MGEYGPVRSDAEIAAHAHNMSWSFHADEKELIEAFHRWGTEKLRILRRNGKPVAGYTLLPMGQWFGGRSVRMAGINLLGVAPEARGQGVATELMHAAIREIRENGFPISTLYPAKQTLYRRAGYELAGGRFRVEVSSANLSLGGRDVTLRSGTDNDEEAIEALYASHAARHEGLLDRPDFLWRRVREPRGGSARCFVVEGDGGLEGYAYVFASKGDGLRHNLNLSDFVVTTGRAAMRMLRFLGDHASLAGDVKWFGDPREPALAHVAEQTWRVRCDFQWMLRIVDVSAALEARGYVPGLRSEIHFEVEDDLIPENGGRYVLHVEDGSGRVRKGGDGRVRCGVRGLASMYSGYLSPIAARIAGLADGDDDALAAAATVFRGPAPWMPDMF